MFNLHQSLGCFLSGNFVSVAKYYLPRKSYYQRVSDKTVSSASLINQYTIAWSSQGIHNLNIGHLMENENRFLYSSEFKERYNIESNFLSYCGLISATKRLFININVNIK